MLSLLIVEDEEIIRETLADIVDWKALGVDLIGTCKDGIEAYDAIIDENPDIVLTDIKMPGLDGLSLVERIFELDIPCVFIILSGYADFSYAQKAMKYDVQFYLIKPCNENEIIEAIQTAAKKAIREKQIRSVFPELEREYVIHGEKEISRRVAEYIDENISNSKLTLKYVAESVLFMNADYVGKQFFLQTGVKFSAYVAQKRIQLAKKIIVTRPNVKITEIAEMVGCGHNPQYFGQMFKRETGVTPSEFMHQQKNG